MYIPQKQRRSWLCFKGEAIIENSYIVQPGHGAVCMQLILIHLFMFSFVFNYIGGINVSPIIFVTLFIIGL